MDEDRMDEHRRRRDRHPAKSLYVAESAEKGLGVYADRTFAPGESVLAFGGPLLAKEEVEDFARCIEVRRGWFRGPSGQIDDFVNHSCAPSCAVREVDSTLEMVALRRIRRGEEITYDYSTAMATEPWTLECRCGSPRCRGTILPFARLPRRVQARFEALGMVPHYILQEAAKSAIREGAIQNGAIQNGAIQNTEA